MEHFKEANDTKTQNGHTWTLQQLRNFKKLSLTRAAGLIGINRGTLARYENGQTHPDICTAQKIAHVYGVSYDNITFLPQKEQKPAQCTDKTEAKSSGGKDTQIQKLKERIKTEVEQINNIEYLEFIHTFSEYARTKEDRREAATV